MYSQQHLLASKVRAKLSREALHPEPNLRKLVLNANMLDRLIEFVKQPPQLSFEIPVKPETLVSIEEIEYDSSSSDSSEEEWSDDDFLEEESRVVELKSDSSYSDDEDDENLLSRYPSKPTIQLAELGSTVEGLQLDQLPSLTHSSSEDEITWSDEDSEDDQYNIRTLVKHRELTVSQLNLTA